jgi:hypothetical protein
VSFWKSQRVWMTGGASFLGTHVGGSAFEIGFDQDIRDSSHS